MAVDQKAEAGAVVGPLLDALGPFYDRNDEQICSNGFHNISSPVHPYCHHPLFGSTDQESHMGFYQADYLEDDSMNEFLNSILITQDEYSEGSKVQQMSTPEVIHSRSGSEMDNEVGLPKGGVGLQDPGWFNMDTMSDYPVINSALYENISLLPYESNGSDVYSLDYGADSLPELFNSMQESNGHMNASSNGVDLEETGIIGIKIRPRQPQHTILDNLSAQQGFARRRIRLQCSVQAGALSSSESESSIEKEDNKDREEIFLVRSVVIEDNEDREATVEVEENNVHDDIVNVKAIPVCPHIKLEDLSIHDDTNSSSDAEYSCLSDITHESPRIKLEDLSIHDDTNSPSNTEESCLSNITPESTRNLRLRARSATEITVSGKLEEESALGPKTSRPDLAMGRVIILVAMLAILNLLCFGIWRWSRSQSLQVSENSI